MSDKWRGHKIHLDDRLEEWLYSEDGQPVKDSPQRPCGYCGLANTPEGHDGCLGTLPDVMNACCGHGSDDEAYIQFEGGCVMSMLRCDYCGKFVKPEDAQVHQPDTPSHRLEPEDPVTLCPKCGEQK